MWYFWFFAFLAIVTGFTLFGISLSAKAMLVLGGFEVSIFLLLAIFGSISPGHGGFNFESFNPNNLPSAKGLYLGVVFTILALSGFEAVAPLAEETENPKRNLPIVIVVSTIGVAIFYAFVNWGVLVGHGTTSVAAGNFTQSTQIFDLARRLWSGAWILVLIATVNSALAVSIAIQNASTRVFFGMGRIGALPRWLGYAHPRWKTPWNAIIAMTVLTVVTAMALGSTIGPTNQFGMIGIVQTLGLIVVYSMGNLGVVWYYYRKRRGEFNWALHGVIPILTSAALVWVGWKTVQGLIFGFRRRLTTRRGSRSSGSWRPDHPLLGQPDRKGGLAVQGRRIHGRAARDSRGGCPPTGYLGGPGSRRRGSRRPRRRGFAVDAIRRRARRNGCDPRRPATTPCQIQNHSN